MEIKCLHKIGDEVFTPTMEYEDDGPNEKGVVVEIIKIDNSWGLEYDCIVKVTSDDGSKYRVRYFDTSLTPCKSR